MTHTTLRSSLESQVHPPPSQNTAPVFEYRCLYTHDLKRKAKRWQDGVLRFHTFNRRVMVYDQARNFIGDTYLHGDLQEGDDLELEKHFALVQVSESTGKTHTDLTELMHGRTKKPRLPSPIRRRADTSHGIASHSTAPAQKHRSLSALLTSSHGQQGRASVPTLSPFEERQKMLLHEAERPKKRQRLSTDLVRNPKQLHTHGTVGGNEAPTNRPNLAASPHAHARPPIHQQAVVVDLCSDDHAAVPRRGDLSITTPVRDTPRIIPDPTPDGIENHQDRRRPLKVISNAPRKMLLCQKALLLPADEGVAPQPKHIDKPSTLFQPGRNIDTSSKKQRKGLPEPDVPLAPHKQRVRDRLARINRPEVADQIAPPLVHTPPEDEQAPRVQRNVSAEPRRVLPSLGLDRFAHREEPVEVPRKTDPAARHGGAAPNPDIANVQPNPAAVPAAARMHPPPRRPAPAHKAPEAVGALASGPWSREAQDLFEWWPPDRDRAGNRIAAVAATAT